MLFLAREPVGSRKLAQLAGLADGTEARTLVRTLNRLYDGEGCAFRAVEVAGGFQLLSRAKFSPWLRRLQDSAAEVRLSAPAMETLAVVAYRQPVLRAEIEAVRGVQCGEILRQLMERDLVRIVGRSEELGRPFLYGTTRRFLQVFGLRHVDELPRPELCRAAKQADGDENVGPNGPEVEPGYEKQDPFVHSIDTGGNAHVKTAIDLTAAMENAIDASAPALVERELDQRTGSADYYDVRASEEEDEKEDLDDGLDDEDDDEEDDEDEEDDLEEDEWEEVEDDEDLEEEADEEEDDEDDDDWDDEDDEDWEDDDEEEKEKGDWE